MAFAELASVIERIACRTYCKTHNKVNLKSFRHLPDERVLVVQSVEAAWAQMNQFSAPATLTVDAAAAQDALDRILTLPLDGYDAILLTAAAREGVTQILTDDADFAHVPGIELFTANRRILDAAHEQNKVVTR